MDRVRVVVGVDGSAGSVGALRWGLEEARRLGADVDAILCWYPPAMAMGNAYAPVYLAPETLLGGAQDLLDLTLSVLATEIRQAKAEGRRVDGRLLDGPAAETLVREAKGAALLVVGRRGHGGLSRLLLGSVSRHVVAHATCPTVVVPEP